MNFSSSKICNKNLIKKQSTHAFGKDIFLLGRDTDGTQYWLEKASWDCGWYWGFGYVETYTNNRNPSKSRDINSHQHIDSTFMGKMSNGDYVHNIYDCPLLAEVTFTKEEGWILSELFKSFYQLKQSAELFGRGSAHITKNPCSELIKNEDWSKQINHEILPLVFEKIYTILSPVKQEGDFVDYESFIEDIK